MLTRQGAKRLRFTSPRTSQAALVCPGLLLLIVSYQDGVHACVRPLARIYRETHLFTHAFFLRFDRWLVSFGVAGLGRLVATQRESWLQRTMDALVSLGHVDGVQFLFAETPLRTCHLLALCCAAAHQHAAMLVYLRDHCDDQIMRLGLQLLPLFAPESSLEARKAVADLLLRAIATSRVRISPDTLGLLQSPRRDM
ncbi:hypothetical protein SPRG_04787 [Saprolegnia parasitica CBS 223.65]|uniref:Uncharacterized protein n=1 Tax=Saprolegnia parasitica (strain CBS 223.65) TaxID=695850 RepID=A0A067CNR8_SAPPC|nr:hypothetical protein SPRG_04787 [Saprolegnia parasitica CBS 223.65]KDO30885.1 hypothetical protein SPRG_04787 [Saprolegnia parasitica CBS 223.65]|eukprot:XP_012198579.1 hypothetical protein SPRG_04787 [Saprolegnia parasitica CBS 223.65]